jgi:Na+-transporting NADH:ubiquinone oxidoreductase subunit NqrE
MSLSQLGTQMGSSFQILGQTFCRHVSSFPFVLQAPSINLDFLNLMTFISKVSKVVPVLNLIKHYAMKAYGGVDV